MAGILHYVLNWFTLYFPKISWFWSLIYHSTISSNSHQTISPLIKTNEISFPLPNHYAKLWHLCSFFPYFLSKTGPSICSTSHFSGSCCQKSCLFLYIKFFTQTFIEHLLHSRRHCSRCLKQLTEQNRKKKKKAKPPNLKKLHASEGIQAVNTVLLKTLNKYNMDINVGVDTFCGKVRAK